eukprot:TRINITY_DN6041_c0_g1_i3.p1 TRINITY_DN6041_c0_g1~~TRINITY_DN6041_c0_g1_i3.p1  ORF type:complete len:287 (-),score=44.86 TRINITY_DN6041_c0_g1_i3:443-1303(-)
MAMLNLDDDRLRFLTLQGVASFVVGYFAGPPLMERLILWRKSQLEDSRLLDKDGQSVPGKVSIKLGDEENYGRIEKEEEVENIFSFFQVFTAAFQSFAHGANDTANAIGPYATIYFLWRYGPSGEEQSTPIWMLAVGGVAIVLGLATFGRQVMETIGVKITNVNFSRGFSVELGSTLCVVIASRLGFPVSTTHCKVGSVVGVGLIHKMLYKLSPRWRPAKELTLENEIGWRVLLDIVISWLITVPVAAFGSSALFGFLIRVVIQGYHSPVPGPQPQNTSILFYNIT